MLADHNHVIQGDKLQMRKVNIILLNQRGVPVIHLFVIKALQQLKISNIKSSRREVNTY